MTKCRTGFAIHPFIMRDEDLACGRGMTQCEIVGISGNCGNECPVFLAGECEEPDGIDDALWEQITRESNADEGGTQ